MSEQNKALIQRLFQETDRRKGTPEELYAPGYTLRTQSNPPMDLATEKPRTAMFYAAFPDLTHVIEDMVAEGDKVCVQMTLSGTHRGSFMGMAPSGKRIAVPAMCIARVAGGKAAAVRFVFDQATMMQQIGAVSAPAQGRG